MIFWSHWKCMTTEPGCLPKDKKTLTFKLIPYQLKQHILKVGEKMNYMQQQIRSEYKDTIHELDPKFKESKYDIYEDDVSDEDEETKQIITGSDRSIFKLQFLMTSGIKKYMDAK